MNTLSTLLCLSALFNAGMGQSGQPPADAAESALAQEVEHFELNKGALIDGLAELSRNSSVRQLHLGIEEILRGRLQSPRDRSVRFSLILDHKSVREILEALCNFDSRYTWSTDGSTVNVYPYARVSDPADLLNFEIERIELKEIPDPDQALTPLSKLFPEEQVGYMEIGGSNSYDAPWTVTFENLSVRRFLNRITEHIGPRATWVWQGGKDGRAFSFLKGGFHTDQSQ